MRNLFTLMKVFICILALIFVRVDILFAGGVNENMNQSAEYTRTMNRNASTDSADASFYNPAGLVKLEDGAYINVSNQFIFKNYRHEVSGTEYKTDYPTLLFPDIYAVYKKDRCFFYGSGALRGGRGKVDCKDGSSTTL